MEAETKWPKFRKRQFQYIFLNENVWISCEILLKFVPNQQNSSIGSDDGLTPTSRQAIIWTNDA